MIFNSTPFLLFFIVVFAVYYLPPVRKRVRLQNWWLLLSSYFFYGYADLKMLPLLLLATILFYGLGFWLKNTMDKGEGKQASRITSLGVCLGIGVLVYFKYFGFFAESFASLIKSIGLHPTWGFIHIIVPVGVSFFTFKLVSYIIEIHREHIEPCTDIIKFATYISFFPAILSGPIDRPNNFLPQLEKNHSFDKDLAFDGVRQVLWGLFTKLCIADTLATLTDSAWTNIGVSYSSTLLLCLLLYPIQLYADFDGYSNMAIGVAKILGIRVTRNFNHPFLARNIAELWRYWHMSLTGWLTDYVFIPLNIRFRNLENVGTIIAIVINFVLIGFWHGADWSFGLFGLYNGLLYIPLIINGTFAKNKKLKSTEKGLPLGKDVLKMISTYFLFAIGLVFFRAPSISEGMQYVLGVFSSNVLSMPQYLSPKLAVAVLFSIVMLILEWIQRKKDYSGQLAESAGWKRVVLDVFLIALILVAGTFGGNQFIYFQF